MHDRMGPLPRSPLTARGETPAAFGRHLETGEPRSPLSLTAAQRAAVARAFAPTLVFHPLENHFPISSLHPQGADSVRLADGDVKGGEKAAITNVVIGGGWFSERQVADIAAGTDLRVGRFTVRPTWRVRERMFNTRVTTAF